MNHVQFKTYGLGAELISDNYNPKNSLGQRNFLDHLQSNVGFFYLCFVFVLILCVLVFSYFGNFQTGSTNLSFYYISITLITTLITPRFGGLVAIFALPIVPALHAQLNTLIPNSKFTAFDYPGIDLLVGLLLGIVIRQFRNWKNRIDFDIPAILIFAHLYLIGSAFLSIVRNLWQSGSSFSVIGLYFNLKEIRHLGWRDDYFPILDVMAYSVSFLSFVAFLSLLRRKKINNRNIVLAISFSALAVCSFALFQSYTHVGWFKSATGVNSTFRDIHSFSGYLLLPAVGSFFFYSSLSRLHEKVFVFFVQIMANYCIFLSGSRFTFFALFPLLAISIVLALPKKKRLLGIIPITGIIGFGLFFLENYGFKSITVSSLINIINSQNSETINQVLSYRPEIFGEAIRFFLAFPIFGLGQGQFYRTSSLPEWGKSPYLVESGGENAHNYFLQTLSELGLVGFLLIFLIFMNPLFRNGKHRKLDSTWIGILFIMCFGNFYSHSFLEREIFFIFTMALACYFNSAPSASESNPHKSIVRKIMPTWLVVLVFSILTLAGAHEIYASFHRLPFQRNLTCFQFHSQWPDNWTSGDFVYELPLNAKGLHLTGHVGQPDVKDRPLKIEFQIKDNRGSVLHKEERVLSSPGPLSFSFKGLDNLNQKLLLEVQLSHCFVPRNYGLNSDRRHLGVVIEKIELIY